MDNNKEISLLGKFIGTGILIFLISFWSERSLNYWGKKYHTHFTYIGALNVTACFYPIMGGFNIFTEFYRHGVYDINIQPTTPHKEPE